MTLVKPSHLSRRAWPLPVYATLLYLGLVTALLVGQVLARRSGLDPNRVVLAMLLLIPVCLAGARALLVALRWPYYRRHLREVLRVDRGGATLYGALPPAMLASVPLCAWLELPFATLWDIGAVAILAGMIPTRLGCLGAGCCAGRPVASRWWGMRLRNARGEWARRHPSPLLEALLGAVLLFALLGRWDAMPFAGAAFLLALGGYSVGRLFLEALREERGARWAGLTEFQWISLGMLVLSAVGLGLGQAAGFADARSGALSGPEGIAFGPAAGRLALSALLLLPVIRLFRFLGCSLFLDDDKNNAPPLHVLRLNVLIPDSGGDGPFDVRMEFRAQGVAAQISGSPFQLEDAGTLGNRLLFDLLQEIPEASYEVTAFAVRNGAATRRGTCSGDLSGPGLQVLFTADPADLPTALTDTNCFGEEITAP